MSWWIRVRAALVRKSGQNKESDGSRDTQPLDYGWYQQAREVKRNKLLRQTLGHHPECQCSQCQALRLL